MKVQIEKLDHFGRGISHINNKICFIENALPYEEVEIEIIKEKKNYLEAKTINIIKDAPNRNNNLCPYYKECGGCNLEHISFKEENIFKENKVKELIERYSNLNKELVKEINYINEYNYRNKLTLHVKSHKLGLFKKHTNELIEIDNCKLVNNKINSLIPTLKELVKINEIDEIKVRTSNDESKVSIKLKGNGIANYNNLLSKVDVLEINNNIVTKNKYLETAIGKINYKVSIDSFFQVNPIITKKIYDKVKEEIIKNKSKSILDLYCGVGTIGLYLKDNIESIIGVDYNSSSIENAKINKKINNVENAKYICDKVENVIDKLKGNIDTIIVDPPRSGLDNKTIKYIKEINPINIIYISCDPITLSRDLKNLKENYKIKEITPYNMFPRTYHVETVCALERSNDNE